GVEHRRLATLEAAAVAGEWIQPSRASDGAVGPSGRVLAPRHKLDLQPLGGEKPFIVGDELWQSLEWGGALQHQSVGHWTFSFPLCAKRTFTQIALLRAAQEVPELVPDRACAMDL